MQLIYVEDQVEGSTCRRRKGEMETNWTAIGKVRFGVLERGERNGIGEVKQFVVDTS
jgi:hypothetical protein